MGTLRRKLNEYLPTPQSIDRALKSEPGVEWMNGDKCVHDSIYGHIIIIPEGLFFKPLDMNKLFKVDISRLSKPESPEEKKKREREQNAIAYFEFETQCFREAGENKQMLTDSWEQADSVAKEVYRIMAEKLNFKTD